MLLSKVKAGSATGFQGTRIWVLPRLHPPVAPSQTPLGNCDWVGASQVTPGFQNSPKDPQPGRAMLSPIIASAASMSWMMAEAGSFHSQSLPLFEQVSSCLLPASCLAPTEKGSFPCPISNTSLGSLPKEKEPTPRIEAALKRDWEGPWKEVRLLGQLLTE